MAPWAAGDGWTGQWLNQAARITMTPRRGRSPDARGAGDRLERAGPVPVRSMTAWRLTVAILLSGLSGLPVAEEAVRDPTQPPRLPASPAMLEPAATPPPRPLLSLQGTMVSDGQRTALINGYLVGEGEVVANTEVVYIEHGWVRLRDEWGDYNLRLPLLPRSSP